MKRYVFFLLGVGIMLGTFYFFKSSQKLELVKSESGLKLLFLKDSSLPYIKYSVLFPTAGADYDPEGKSGLASLTAYLLDQGAGNKSSAELQKELNQLGTELNVEVGRQFVRISLSGLSWHKEKLLELFKDILVAPLFKEEELAILKKQMINKRIKSLDRPSSVANQILRKQLFPGSLGESVNGNLLSLSEIHLEDIKNFYETRYKKSQAIFTIAGDFKRELKQNLKDFVNKSFTSSHIARWDQSENLLPDLLQTKKTPQIILVSNPDLVQAELRLAYHLFPFPTQNPREFLAMKLANTVLGGGSMISRLFFELREKRGLTYSSHTSLNLGKLYGFFDFYGATKTETLKLFLEQALLQLEKIQGEGITPEELKTAKQILKISYLKNIETPESQLNRRVYYEHYLGLRPDFLKNYTRLLLDLSLEEVNESIKKIIFTNSLQVVIYGHPSIESQLKAMDKPWPLKVIPFKEYFKEELKQKPQ